MSTKQGQVPKVEAKQRRRPATKKLAVRPSHEEIARLAERYWFERGRPEGSPEQDWLRAEEELRGKAS